MTSRSIFAHRGPAAPGSVTCRASARLTSLSTRGSQNSLWLSFDGLFGANDLHVSRVLKKVEGAG